MEERQVGPIGVMEIESETCKDCFCWQPCKDGYKCILSGKKVLGSMCACQLIDSRRALLVAIVTGADEF